MGFKQSNWTRFLLTSLQTWQVWDSASDLTMELILWVNDWFDLCYRTISKVIFLCVFAWDWTQGLTHAKHMLCLWTTSPDKYRNFLVFSCTTTSFFPWEKTCTVFLFAKYVFLHIFISSTMVKYIYYNI
jgi:hypothetical protein